MQRIHQVVLIGSILALSWLGMMIVHEAGHAIGAWLTGGTVSKVVLHPFAISRTDLADNPHPLFVVWAGPVLGILLPLSAFAVTTVTKLPGSYLLRFFAGFCLIANGAYLGIGSFEGIGDAGEMVREGSGIWQLWLFGAVTIPMGLLLWNRLGTSFGLGESKGKVSQVAAYSCLILLLVVIAIEFAFGGE